MPVLAELLLFVFLAAFLAWGALLYLLSPILMGGNAPRSAQALWNIFRRNHLTGTIKVIRLSYAEGHIAIASALLVSPPVVIDLMNPAGQLLVVTDADTDGFTGSNATVQLGLTK